MKTEIASEVGKHAFEVAGLGLAPFRFVGASENVITHPDGTQQAGGCCAYCYTGIRLECRVVSADNKSFVVGCNCIAKVGDTGLLKAYKTSPDFRRHQAKLRAVKAKAVFDALTALIASKKEEFSAKPHPYGFVDRVTGTPMTYLDYINYQFDRCGAAGRAAMLKAMQKAAA